MIRALSEPLFFFAIPFAIYIAFLALQLVNPFAIDNWTRRVVVPLTLAGLLLAVGSLVVLGTLAPRHLGGYVPAHEEQRAARAGAHAMRPEARALLAHAPLARALDLLDRDGEEARLVGGAVRNALMGRPVADWDVTTTATPDVVMARAAAARLRTIPTGLTHGTVTLMIDGSPIEVTTLREDIGTDGRHATVRFGRDFETDALRRDFTINALSLSRAGTIHDYAGGLDDLAAARVRFIGDAATRIREDYLRTLRFLRFSAEYASGPLDPAGLAAAIRERAGLARLSRERVRQELMKLVAARRAVEVITQGAEVGLLGPLLRSVPQPRRLARLVAIAPDAEAILRLAALAAIVPRTQAGCVPA